MTQILRLVVRRTTDSILTEEILAAAGIVGLALMLRALTGFF